MLRFAPRVAARVLEATWHPTQARGDRGRTARCAGARRSSGTIEIRLWILSWGDDVEVLAPAALRGDVAATLRRALARYEADRSMRLRIALLGHRARSR